MEYVLFRELLPPESNVMAVKCLILQIFWGR